MPADPQLETTWTAFLDRLQDELPDHVFRVWLQPVRAVGLSDGVLYLEAPKETRDWIRRRFGDALSRLLVAVDPSLDRVELITSADAGKHARSPVPTRFAGLNPAHRFEEYVIGAGNRFAHAAALAAAELPGQAYNPLFLHGPPGAGKTHLLNAIGNYTTLNDKVLDVLYVTGETFTSDFTAAVRSGEMEIFKKRYRQPDLLLLDDVHFVERKPKTAEELLHTFDALMTKGTQLVIAADRPPGSMPGLDSRLRDRLDSGLVVDLQPADFETRLSIVRRRATSWGSTADHLPALELLARQLHPSIHALEGALIRVRAYASLTQQPITPALVEHVLTNLYTTPAIPPPTHEAPSVARIQQATSATFQLAETDLTSAKRGRQVVYARQVAMYLCRELTNLSLPTIGQSFGGRDHTTVLHAHKQIRSRLLTDESTRKLVDEVLSQLRQTATTQ